MATASVLGENETRMNQGNYFVHDVRSETSYGKALVARYVSEVGLDQLDTDLESKESFLKQYFEFFSGVDIEKYRKEHSVRARALLGALTASNYCLETTGRWLSMEAPPTKAFSGIPEGEPVATIRDVKLWKLEETSDSLS